MDNIHFDEISGIFIYFKVLALIFINFSRHLINTLFTLYPPPIVWLLAFFSGQIRCKVVNEPSQAQYSGQLRFGVRA